MARRKRRKKADDELSLPLEFPGEGAQHTKSAKKAKKTDDEPNLFSMMEAESSPEETMASEMETSSEEATLLDEENEQEVVETHDKLPESNLNGDDAESTEADEETPSPSVTMDAPPPDSSPVNIGATETDDSEPVEIVEEEETVEAPVDEPVLVDLDAIETETPSESPEIAAEDMMEETPSEPVLVDLDATETDESEPVEIIEEETVEDASVNEPTEQTAYEEQLSEPSPEEDEPQTEDLLPLNTVEEETPVDDENQPPETNEVTIEDDSPSSSDLAEEEKLSEQKEEEPIVEEEAEPMVFTLSVDEEVDSHSETSSDDSTEIEQPETNQDSEQEPILTLEAEHANQEKDESQPLSLGRSRVVGKIMTDNATTGQVLQEARVRLNLSHAQVEHRTKIKKAFIECIERDDFTSLPPVVYVNAYLKMLCELYQLNEEETKTILGRIKEKNQKQHVPEELLHDLDSKKQVNQHDQKKFTRIVTVVTVLLVALFITASILIWLKFRKSDAEKTTASEKTVATIEKSPTPSGEVKPFKSEKLERFIRNETITMTELKVPLEKKL